MAHLMDDFARAERLRALPSIDELLSRPALAHVVASVPRAVAVAAAREAVSEARVRLHRGAGPSFDEAAFVQKVHRMAGQQLRPVLNATGVVLHTNLGRAPLSQAVMERLSQVAQGYCNLELDLQTGERGSRYEPVIPMLRLLTGAEDALVVNNGAAAVLLVLTALTAGREVVISRGELIEIGGGFRIPEVMKHSGAILKEVGTTNRTRLDDYRDAITANTAALLKVHRSNFVMTGFCEEVTVKALSQLGAEKKLPVLVDLGSGALTDFNSPNLPPEPTVASMIRAGADVVVFSGDKLLGGPQAGLIVGRTQWLEPLKKHPLNRALRVDKLTVAALEATLSLYRDGRADEDIPVRAALLEAPEVLEVKAHHLSSLLGTLPHRVLRTEGQVGGGSLPSAQLPSWAVGVETASPERLQHTLRTGSPAILTRIADGVLLVDVRCVDTLQLELIAHALQEAVESEMSLPG